MTSKVVVPAGAKITVQGNGLNVPNNPIIPFIEGDGIGSDITPAMIKVVDAAVAKAYNGAKKISWMEIYAGEKATKVYGQDVWLPDETLDLLKEYVVSIKGPLTTPIGGGIRSLNVALRQQLDLYICLRPVRYFEGVPSPVKHPELVDMVIFRENSEDIYAGVEWKAGTPEADKVINFLKTEMGVTKIRFDKDCGIGVKPVSKEGTQRLVKAAIEYAIANNRKSVTLVHKGNIMKFTEGAFKQWGYEVAKEQYNAELIGEGPWMKIKNPKNGEDIVIKDCIADAFLQQLTGQCIDINLTGLRCYLHLVNTYRILIGQVHLAHIHLTSSCTIAGQTDRSNIGKIQRLSLLLRGSVERRLKINNCYLIPCQIRSMPYAERCLRANDNTIIRC